MSEITAGGGKTPEWLSPFYTYIEKASKRSGVVESFYYLKAIGRILWFRSECPVKDGWRVSFEDVVHNPGQFAKVRCRIISPEGHVVQEATKCCSGGKMAPEYESAETGAYARALGFMGYGTGHEPDLIEEDKDDLSTLADSPVNSQKSPQRQDAQYQQYQPQPSAPTFSEEDEAEVGMICEELRAHRCRVWGSVDTPHWSEYLQQAWGIKGMSEVQDIPQARAILQAVRELESTDEGDPFAFEQFALDSGMALQTPVVGEPDEVKLPAPNVAKSDPPGVEPPPYNPHADPDFDPFGEGSEEVMFAYNSWHQRTYGVPYKGEEAQEASEQARQYASMAHPGGEITEDMKRAVNSRLLAERGRVYGTGTKGVNAFKADMKKVTGVDDLADHGDAYKAALALVAFLENRPDHQAK